MNALLLDIPERLETARLVLRVPRAGDGPMVCASVRESLAELKPWMPWAKDEYCEKDAEEWCRRNASEFLARTLLNFLILLPDGEHIGNCGTHDINWNVPKFEIGYWLRTRYCGKGYITETVDALTKLLFEHLHAARIEIRTDARNQRSWRVAERCGFALEGTLRQDCRDVERKLRDTRVYSKIA